MVSVFGKRKIVFFFFVWQASLGGGKDSFRDDLSCENELVGLLLIYIILGILWSGSLMGLGARKWWK